MYNYNSLSYVLMVYLGYLVTLTGLYRSVLCTYLCMHDLIDILSHFIIYVGLRIKPTNGYDLKTVLIIAAAVCGIAIYYSYGEFTQSIWSSACVIAM